MFLVHTHSLALLLASHGVNGHSYADDCQIYLPTANIDETKDKIRTKTTIIEDIFTTYKFQGYMPPLQCGRLSPTLKRGHVALELVCGENMSSIIVVFNFQFEFEIELITKIPMLLSDIKTWMKEQKLNPNESKTKIMLINTFLGWG